jgi:hypothetical protein
MLAIILDKTDDFAALFSEKAYQSLDEIIHSKKQKTRKRGKKN